jgi:hypothetical protein
MAERSLDLQRALEGSETQKDMCMRQIIWECGERLKKNPREALGTSQSMARFPAGGAVLKIEPSYYLNEEWT